MTSRDDNNQHRDNAAIRRALVPMCLAGVPLTVSVFDAGRQPASSPGGALRGYDRRESWFEGSSAVDPSRAITVGRSTGEAGNPTTVSNELAQVRGSG